jgi:hypothetical protein
MALLKNSLKKPNLVNGQISKDVYTGLIFEQSARVSQVLKPTILDSSAACFFTAEYLERGNQIGIGVPQRARGIRARGDFLFNDFQIGII